MSVNIPCSNGKHRRLDETKCTLQWVAQAQSGWKSSKVLAIVTIVNHTQVQVYNVQIYPNSVSIMTSSYYAGSIQE